MKREDWLLLALACADDSGLSPVQLQKVLFVLGREMPNIAGDRYYEFNPYHYGPFDANVYRDATWLSVQGLVSVSTDESALRHYSITHLGQARASKLRGGATAAALDYLTRVVAWAQGLSFSQLVKSIYAHYPETSVNSVFRG
jgi:hypothetical protein